jgi:ligand-binding SRPBCC domain-containing protein
MFEDVMVRGAFAPQRHVHGFVRLESGTTMVDTPTFESRSGRSARLSDRLFLAGYMRRFLAARAEELKRVAESA